MALTLLALVFQSTSYFYQELFPVKPLYSELELMRVKAALAEEAWLKEKRFHQVIQAFDPNQVDSSFLAELQLPLPLQNSWKAYLHAKGQFRRPEDLQNLYHMDSAWYAKLEPYINIGEKPSWAPRTRLTDSYRFSPFDPNLVEKHELEAMGLDSYESQRILNFREKYRPFEKAEDLYKVYGLSKTLVDQLLAYAIIKKERAEEPSYKILLNQADSLQLAQVPALGHYRINRLLYWRRRLGGFHSKRQLLDLQILDSLRYQELKSDLHIELQHQQLNLNQQSLEGLRRHPYINYYLAQHIIDFREQIRPFKSVQELMNIELVDDVLFSKLAPYLKVSEKDTSALTLSN